MPLNNRAEYQVHKKNYVNNWKHIGNKPLKMMKEQQISPKQETCKMIEKTIKAVKIEYRETEQKIKASGIQFATVNMDSLIHTVCRKNRVKEKTVRMIAGWENLKTGSAASRMFLNSTDE